MASGGRSDPSCTLAPRRVPVATLCALCGRRQRVTSLRAVGVRQTCAPRARRPCRTRQVLRTLLPCCCRMVGPPGGALCGATPFCAKLLEVPYAVIVKLAIKVAQLALGPRAIEQSPCDTIRVKGLALMRY